MVVEHTFVTTLPTQEALARASQFLTAGGFEVVTERAFSVDSNWSRLNVRRGKQMSTRARSIIQLPQEFHVGWDRGRVTVAGSISDRYSAKQRALLLTTIADGLEEVLARQMPLEPPLQAWKAVDQKCSKRGVRQILITLAVIVIFVAVFAIINQSNG